MDFQDAIRKIEERGDFNRYAEVKLVFEEQCKRLRKTDHTERGLCYYYLLVSYLKAQLVHETEESKEFYKAMDREFSVQEHIYKNHSQKFSPGEIQDFYHLMERSYNALEILYDRHGFRLRRNLAYERKMRFRKNSFFLNKDWGRWLEYKLLELSCHYGTSLSNWALTTLAITIIFGLTYFVLDQTWSQDTLNLGGGEHWYDYFYFSIVVATTLGLGDIFPTIFISKLLVAFESFVGFLMLGVFVGLMQKKLF